MPLMPLTDYQTEVEHFSIDLARQSYLSGAGLKPTLETAAVEQRYERLFAFERVRDLVAARHEGKIERFLAEFAVLRSLNNRVRALTDRTTNALRRATVEWDERTIPIQSAAAVIAGEPDVGRRHTLERLSLAESAKLNPDRRERWERLHQEAERLGFATYAALCDDLRGLNLSWLADQARALLDQTAERYFAELDELLWSVGVTRADSTPADVARLARAGQFDELFPKDDLLPSLNRTLAGLGIVLDRQPGFFLDVEPRLLKSPRTFCAAIRVPDEVRLVVWPKGGPAEYRALYHEAGHAEHYLHADGRLPFAYRRLGDAALTEAYAFLFEGLSHDPGWLRLVLGRRPTDTYLRLARFLKRRMARRAAARLAYERELHGGGSPRELPDRYRAHLGAALGHAAHAEEYLADVDDAFDVAQSLRAWILEAQLRAYLVREYGEAWFARRSAGDVVRDLWTSGQRLMADEVAKELGAAGLNAEPLIKELA